MNEGVNLGFLRQWFLCRGAYNMYQSPHIGCKSGKPWAEHEFCTETVTVRTLLQSNGLLSEEVNPLSMRCSFIHSNICTPGTRYYSRC